MSQHAESDFNGFGRPELITLEKKIRAWGQKSFLVIPNLKNGGARKTTLFFLEGQCIFCIFSLLDECIASISYSHTGLTLRIKGRKRRRLKTLIEDVQMTPLPPLNSIHTSRKPRVKY